MKFSEYKLLIGGFVLDGVDQFAAKQKKNCIYIATCVRSEEYAIHCHQIVCSKQNKEVEKQQPIRWSFGIVHRRNIS